MNYAEIVEGAWAEHTRREKSRSPSGKREYVYASGWHPCKRAMALDLMHPEDRRFSEDALERFMGGDAFERNVVAHLMHAGPYAAPPFEVEGGQQRLEIFGRRREHKPIIVGKVDGFLRFHDRRRVVFEVKGGVSVQNVQTLDDMERGRWTRPMLYQLLAYMLGLEVERGLFVLNRPGRPKFLPVRLDDQSLDKAEDFLQRAELAVDVAEGQAELPDFTPYRALCQRCDHKGRSCAPPLDYGEGLQILNDPRLLKLAQEREENREAADRFKKADKVLKAELRGAPLVHLGSEFEVSGRWSPLTKYDVPKEVKQQHKKVDPKGRWLMKIDPLT